MGIRGFQKVPVLVGRISRPAATLVHFVGVAPADLHDHQNRPLNHVEMVHTDLNVRQIISHRLAEFR